MTDFKDFLAEQLQDPEIRAEYEALMQDVQEKLAVAQTQHQAGNGRPLADLLKESEQKMAYAAPSKKEKCTMLPRK